MRRYMLATLRQRLVIPVLAGALLSVVVFATGLDHELRARLVPAGPPQIRDSGAALWWLLNLMLGLFVGTGLWVVLSQILFEPVDTLLRTLRAIGAGDLAARTGVTPDGRGELAELAREVDVLAGRLETQRHRQAIVDEALRQSEARKAIIVAASRDGIVTFDANARVLEFNPAAERLFGVPAAVILGQRIDDFLLPLDEVGERLRVAQLDGRTIETHALRSDGSRFPCELCVESASTTTGERLYTAYVRDLTARRRYEQALRDLSFLDDLTRLYNRRGFLRFAEQQLQLSDRSGSGTTLVFADLDGFKAINDAHGHETGDRAIVAVAEALRQTFRQSDVLGRIGGDEFVVFATESGAEQPAQRIQRLNAALAEHAVRLGLPLTLSAGLVRRAAGSRMSVLSMIARADALMYAEKRRRAGDARGVAMPADSAA